jgi:hypothetical protein
MIRYFDNTVIHVSVVFDTKCTCVLNIQLSACDISQYEEQISQRPFNKGHGKKNECTNKLGVCIMRARPVHKVCA